MVSTRNQQEAAVKHILEVILGQSAGSSIHLALDGVQDPFYIASLRDSEIAKLIVINPDDGTTQPLPHYHCHLLSGFHQFLVHHQSANGPLSADTLTLLTRDDFDAFRISPANLDPSSAPLAPAPATRASQTSDSVRDFKRGIKRDPAAFSSLKDDKHWDTWQRHTLATARAQDVDDVLDPSYKPPTSEARDLFKEKQKYVYSVLETFVLTDVGKSIVRKHESTFDAQLVFKELVAHAQSSTKASLDSAELLSYITSVRIGDGSWKGSTHSFILHWQDQVRLYETLVPTSDHFSDGQKRTMLENVVHPLMELRSVKDQAAQHQAHTGQALSYDQYCTLLLSASQAYDKQFAPKHAPRASKRAVYSHAIHDPPAPDSDDDIFFDINSPLNVIQAFASDTRRPRSRLTGDQWHRLPSSAQAIWDQLDESAKQIILEAPAQCRFPPRPPPSRGTPRSTNLHDISAFDFLSSHLAPDPSGDHDI